MRGLGGGGEGVQLSSAQRSARRHAGGRLEYFDASLDLTQECEAAAICSSGKSRGVRLAPRCVGRCASVAKHLSQRATNSSNLNQSAACRPRHALATSLGSLLPPPRLPGCLGGGVQVSTRLKPSCFSL